jgi:uncharacterized protein (UPF0335 family)
MADSDDWLDEPKGIGHNSGEKDERLIGLLDRIARLEEEKKGISDDIRDVYAEGKAVGYDTKMMRQMHALRKMKPDDRSEQETIRETYKTAVGLD